MGNEASQLTGLEINEKAVEVTDFWTHHHAIIKDSCRYFSLKGDGSLSVFKGENNILGPLWTLHSPLEKCSNNLLKYRHPCIVRYISAWQQRSTLHLATEFVQPLSIVLHSQSPLQIFVGLNNILQALVFLHDQAAVSHNNVSISAIYVTADGEWKLGGMQYLCRLKDITSSYLKHARIHRYDKAVDPNEDSPEVITRVDQYAFAVLVDDVFKGKREEDLPQLREFRNYCRQHLQNGDATFRPQLSQVLLHDIFKHDFVVIYKFLNLLPLKSEQEKCEFFTGILAKLRLVDEETVAKQLGGNLLSRMVLIDDTARSHLLPYIFAPRDERQDKIHESGLFSISIFKEHMKPRLLQIFCVRDVQIRLLLLKHFPKYVQVFSHEELSLQVLPELLLGIKDTNDSLVANTLLCLSELVPILGASTVIGGKRNKIFNDGRPTPHKNTTKRKSQTQLLETSIESLVQNNRTNVVKSLKDFPCTEEISESSNESMIIDLNLHLQERPSPLGKEAVDDEIVKTNVDSPENNPIANLDESDGHWSDWETTHNQTENNVIETNSYLIGDDVLSVDNSNLLDNTSKLNSEAVVKTVDSPKDKATLLQKAALEVKNRKLLDISELDIKTQSVDFSKGKAGDEYDFFADMKPVIETAMVGNYVEPKTENSTGLSSKFNFIPTEEVSDSGKNDAWGADWDDDL